MIESLDTIAKQPWDAIVIGAGPAGGLAANLLSKRGYRTLLVEKSRWPRDKTCGGCVNARAMEILQSHDLAGDIIRAGTVVDRVQLRTKTRCIDAEIPEGLAIGRREMDSLLVDAFTRSGGTFLCDATATIATASAAHRSVRLHRANEQATISAGVVLMCDGLSGTALQPTSRSEWVQSPDAWVGVATGDVEGVDARPGTIEMHVADGGYVGMVALPSNKVHIAAALSPACCRDEGPRQTITRILSDCRDERIELPADLRLIGTGPLTKKRTHLGQHRLLFVGDACGYVEPFTGQGIAWALATAEAAVGLLPAPGNSWPTDLPARWQALHRATVGNEHRRCQAIRFGLHRPTLTRATAFLLNRIPALAKVAIT